MDEKLKQIENRYSELEQRMSQPEVYSDAKRFAELSKEYNSLQPFVSCLREIRKCKAQLEEAELLMSDPEFFALAQEEHEEIKKRLPELEQNLRLLLLPKDPNDDKNVIMEIRGGVGGEEGMLFASDLYRMYSMYADKMGWKTELVNVNETELGGIKELTMIISGASVWSRLKYEAGGHRVQRVPVTESGGRIHTSAATVAVLPEVEEVAFELNPNELKIDTYRSSGAGGQHINKTESAIRITHIPTGLVVECQDERSQYKNKDRAMSILRSRLSKMEEDRKNAEIAAERKSQVGTGDRSDRVRTYNFPQNRVTDHRLHGENRSFNIDLIINGNLDPLIDALISEERLSQLESVTE